MTPASGDTMLGTNSGLAQLVPLADSATTGQQKVPEGSRTQLQEGAEEEEVPRVHADLFEDPLLHPEKVGS